MNTLIENASEYVKELMSEQLPQGCTYHSLEHTIEVAKAAEFISNKMGISEKQKEKVLLAGWFHDTGIIKKYEDHEDESIQICQDYLKNIDYPSDDINDVCKAILKTHLPSNPENIIEKVLCDADVSYAGKKEFSFRSELLRTEWYNILGREYTNTEWLENNIRFLSSIKFYTEFAKRTYDLQRQKTLFELKKKLEKLPEL